FIAPLALLRHEFDIINSREYLLLLRISGYIEFLLIFSFLFLNFSNSTIKFLLLLLWILFTAYYIYDWYFSKKDIYSPYPIMLGVLFTLVLLLFFLFEEIKRNVHIPLYETKTFWFIVAFMFFFSGVFFLLILSKTMINDKNFRNQYRIISTAFIVLKNIYVCIGIFVKEKAVVKSDNSIEEIGR